MKLEHLYKIYERLQTL